MITQREVSRTAFRTRKQDRVVEKDYVITWLLLGIAGSALAGLLAFKGGTALKKIYFADYRFSEDLDFTLTGEADTDEILTLLIQVIYGLSDEVAITARIDENKLTKRPTSLTAYVEFVGPLQGTLGSRNIKMDFTLKEEIIFPLACKDVLVQYSDCDSLSRSLHVYSLEEILTEKLCALIGRTEPRDLYDTHFLLGLGTLDYQSIPPAFATKAASKEVDPDRLSAVLGEREATISRLWNSRLALQVDSLPPVERVLRETRRSFRRLGLP